MSFKVVQKIRPREVGSPTLKAVLMNLAHRASDDGSGVWPAVARVAAETEFGRTTVIKTMRKLEEQRLIQRTGTLRKGTIVYCINLEAVCELPLRRCQGKELALERTTLGAAEVREVNRRGSTCGTQTLKRKDSYYTGSDDRSPAQEKISLSSLSPDIQTAASCYEAVAVKMGWVLLNGRLRRDQVSILEKCVQHAGGLEGWHASMQRASQSNFLCAKGIPFQNNLTYILKNFEKLQSGGFDNASRGRVHEPMSRFQKSADTMAMILKDAGQKFQVEVWKLRSKRFAPDFPEAVRWAVEMMRQQGTADTDINAFMGSDVTGTSLDDEH